MCLKTKSNTYCIPPGTTRSHKDCSPIPYWCVWVYVSKQLFCSRPTSAVSLQLCHSCEGCSCSGLLHASWERWHKPLRSSHRSDGQAWCMAPRGGTLLKLTPKPQHKRPRAFVEQHNSGFLMLANYIQCSGNSIFPEFSSERDLLL